MFNLNTPVGYQPSFGTFRKSPSSFYHTPSPIKNEIEGGEESFSDIDDRIQNLIGQINALRYQEEEIKEEIEGDEESNKGEENKIKEEINKIEDENKIENIKEYFLTKGCDNLFKHLTDIKILKKESASISIIMFAKLHLNKQENDIVLKVSYKSKNPLNNSLKVEEQIYNNIVSNLLENKNTPHLVNHIASINNCNLSFPKHKFNREDFNDIKEQLLEFENDYDISKANVIILEKTTGNMLRQEMEILKPNDQLLVIFQLLYTLRCFNNITLRHNDLHFGNVFVERVPREEYYYNIDSKIINVDQNIIIKIYDFDRSSIYSPAVSRNFETDINYCKDYNQCANLNEKIDLQAVISLLWFYKSILSSTIIKWITEITSDKMRENFEKRYYKHIAEKEDIHDKDLLPLSTCLKMLIQIMKNNGICEEVDTIIEQKSVNIYTLPNKYKIQYHFPVSTETHVLKFIRERKSELTDNEIKTILSSNNPNQLFFIYVDEFKKMNYSIPGEALNLCKKLYKLKKMTHTKLYFRYCLLMVLPFWYKTDPLIRQQLSFYFLVLI